ncbi:MAG TPA: 3-phosphoshikimate 1-carboxyvinyltransferase [Flavitalea sp.]|nr:3-phosphoshikimate 1-carboxyvinyltransferase [Flavitalea sp.]
MGTIISPSSVTGSIQAPASKSSMQRACAAALLSKGTSVIKQPGHSNDDLAARDVITKLGATVSVLENGSLEIASSGINPVADFIDCGESGLGIRMFTPMAALSNESLSIRGSGSLLKRPMDFFDQIFPKLQIRIQSNGGKLPIQIKGPLVPANITIDGSLSSQFLTGLLMAYAAAGAKDVSIIVTDLKSRPYIDLTLDVLKKFGVQVTNSNYESFSFHGSTLQPTTYTVEGDWSGGAFLIVAGAIAGPVVINGLDPQSTQADKAILQAVMASGAAISVTPGSIEVGPGALKAFHFDATDCPDLFPPLVALASYCSGTSVIQGVSRLAHKESDRGATLQQEFGKMGIDIRLQDDIMLVTGGTGVRGAVVHSHHDHRIAMACAVAALKADADTEIEVAEAVGKSYPDFFDHMKLLGASVHSTLLTSKS